MRTQPLTGCAGISAPYARAKQQLTILHDPADTRPMSALNPALATLFASAPTRTLADGISERRWQP